MGGDGSRISYSFIICVWGRFRVGEDVGCVEHIQTLKTNEKRKVSLMGCECSKREKPQDHESTHIPCSPKWYVSSWQKQKQKGVSKQWARINKKSASSEGRWIQDRLSICNLELTQTSNIEK